MTSFYQGDQEMTLLEKEQNNIKARARVRGLFGTLTGVLIMGTVLFTLTGRAQTIKNVGQTVAANQKEKKMTQVKKAPETTPADTAIRPFRINIPEEALT